MKFARLLAVEMRDASIVALDNDHIRLRGRLDFGAQLATLVVVMHSRFAGLKKAPPLVWSKEPWMKHGADWHNRDSLCWVLPEEWQDAMNWKGKPVASIMEEGRRWFLDGVRCLLSRHYFAHLEGIEKWPAEWAAWGHEEAGIKEYRAAKKSHRKEE